MQLAAALPEDFRKKIAQFTEEELDVLSELWPDSSGSGEEHRLLKKTGNKRAAVSTHDGAEQPAKKARRLDHESRKPKGEVSAQKATEEESITADHGGT